MLVSLVATQPGQADSPERIAKTNHAAWQVNCAMCHMAYPAVLMPRASWRRIMTTLEHHFGENASLDAPSRRAITAYLLANACDTDARGPVQKNTQNDDDAPLRITRFSWFIAAHNLTSGGDDNNGPRKSLGDCAACHRGALQGIFARDG